MQLRLASKDGTKMHPFLRTSSRLTSLFLRKGLSIPIIITSIAINYHIFNVIMRIKASNDLYYLQYFTSLPLSAQSSSTLFEEKCSS